MRNCTYYGDASPRGVIPAIAEDSDGAIRVILYSTDDEREVRISNSRVFQRIVSGHKAAYTLYGSSHVDLGGIKFKNVESAMSFIDDFRDNYNLNSHQSDFHYVSYLESGLYIETDEQKHMAKGDHRQ